MNICDVSVSGQPHAHRAASGAEDGNWSCAERIQGSAHPKNYPRLPKAFFSCSPRVRHAASSAAVLPAARASSTLSAPFLKVSACGSTRQRGIGIVTPGVILVSSGDSPPRPACAAWPWAASGSGRPRRRAGTCRGRTVPRAAPRAAPVLAWERVKRPLPRRSAAAPERRKRPLCREGGGLPGRRLLACRRGGSVDVVRSELRNRARLGRRGELGRWRLRRGGVCDAPADHVHPQRLRVCAGAGMG